MEVLQAMKRCCILLLCAVLTAGLLSVSALADDGGWTDISDAAGMLAIAGDPNGSYRLTADINMEGVEWIPSEFHGTFDGQGHTVYNLTVTEAGTKTLTTYDGNLKPYDTVFAGLFSDASGATVENVSLTGLYICVTAGTNCFAAGIAGFTDGTVISGCSVSGRIWMYGESVMVGVAGIAGFGSADISGCDADVELVFADRSEGTKCEQFMGGVLGCGVASINDCTVTIDGYDSCNGYVHDGGLVGLFYNCCRAEGPFAVTNCVITGMITFFENNIDRRAYCVAGFGETLTGQSEYSGVDGTGFVRNEVFTYDEELYPETCASPEYTDEVTAGTCDSWGYTTHTCAVCGYSWTDTYTEPQHTPGEYVTVTEPGYGVSGLQKQYCTECGEELGERELPPLTPASGCTLDRAQADLNYKETLVLTATLTPAGVSDAGTVWSSSDESVATVSDDGTVTATGRGSAVITCASDDGYAEASCAVTVRFSAFQWFIQIILFGWLWGY